MLTRRSVLFGGLAATIGFSLEGSAQATVARALSLSELVHQSGHGFVGTPGDSFSRWETIGKRSRIVTYTSVRADYALDVRGPGTAEVMVRTLGGAVGDIGQTVPGEALLVKGEPTAVFVQAIAQDLFVVTGMAQGLYPVRPDIQGVRRLRAATGQLALFRAQADAAVVRLDGRTVAETETLVREELLRGAR
jgi:hypothetical protein